MAGCFSGAPGQQWSRDKAVCVDSVYKLATLITVSVKSANFQSSAKTGFLLCLNTCERAPEAA